MKVVIVGAGIGGLTLGVALRRQGHEVLVLEKRPHFQDEGAGVVLGPNVMLALQVLGLAASVQAAGNPVVAMNITDQQGRVLARSGYRVAELPLPGVAIHRSRLHEILRQRFDGDLRLGQQVQQLGVEPRPALLLDGERIECDLIVGADGIRSQARRLLDPSFEPRYAGSTCFRFVVDEVVSDEVYEMWAPGKRVGVVPLGHGRSYVFLTLNAPPRAPKPFASLEQLRALWSEFAAPARDALAALGDLSPVLHNDLEDGLAAKFWAPGLVLLGDAAHAVTPNMGQGAGLAIEDACCLSHLLSQDRELDAALAEYEALRRPRATWIRDRSFSLGRLAQLESPFLCWLRNLALRLTPAAMNERALRRIVTDMPGVPLEPALPQLGAAG